MTTALFLVGLPGAGKSTFREIARPGYIVASSDDFIEMEAKSAGKTYNDVFKGTIDAADKHFNHMVFHAVSLNSNLIVDRTNLTVSSRRKTLAKIPVAWRKVAAVFIPKEVDTWRKRLASRPGKTIPDHVMKSMGDNFELPSKEEGFDEVLVYWT